MELPLDRVLWVVEAELFFMYFDGLKVRLNWLAISEFVLLFFYGSSSVTFSRNEYDPGFFYL